MFTLLAGDQVASAGSKPRLAAPPTATSSTAGALMSDVLLPPSAAVFTLEEEFPVVCTLAQQAFTLFPRVVLSCCLQSFLSADRAQYTAGVWLVQYLLSDTKQPHAAPVAQPPSGRSCAAVLRTGSSPDKLAAQPTCLAAEVLGQLPDTQLWLRQAIASVVSKGLWGAVLVRHAASSLVYMHVMLGSRAFGYVTWCK